MTKLIINFFFKFTDYFFHFQIVMTINREDDKVLDLNRINKVVQIMVVQIIIKDDIIMRHHLIRIIQDRNIITKRRGAHHIRIIVVIIIILKVAVATINGEHKEVVIKEIIIINVEDIKEINVVDIKDMIHNNHNVILHHVLIVMQINHQPTVDLTVANKL